MARLLQGRIIPPGLPEASPDSVACRLLKVTPPTSEDKTSGAELENTSVRPSVLTSWHPGKFAKPPPRTEEEALEYKCPHGSDLEHTQSTSTLTRVLKKQSLGSPTPYFSPKLSHHLFCMTGWEGISSGFPSDFRALPSHPSSSHNAASLMGEKLCDLPAPLEAVTTAPGQQDSSPALRSCLPDPPSAVILL